ncbi:unnamed protein product [Oikopleura dioica]|uniref:Uncharacterized protein n=1 Tax=Oikopleura dioica TaxID=34765 RepID=E4XTL2_OIKDI|nr:unnamed protein product [Oikopleura dioica]
MGNLTEDEAELSHQVAKARMQSTAGCQSCSQQPVCHSSMPVLMMNKLPAYTPKDALSSKAKDLRIFARNQMAAAFQQEELKQTYLKEELRVAQDNKDNATQYLNRQVNERNKLAEENRSLRKLLQNADEQLSTLNSSITNEQAFRGKSSYIIDRFKEQKEVFSELERSLTNTNRMIKEIEGQMQSLRVDHSNCQNEGLKIRAKIETTIEDARKTRKELDLMEGSIKNKHSPSKCSHRC